MTDDSLLDRRWRCRECHIVAIQRDILAAPNPFYPEETIWGCPDCRSVVGFELLCDEPGCDEIGGCGWPSPTGYRHTCGVHMEEDKS